MKRFLGLLFSFCILFSLCGCSFLQKLPLPDAAPDDPYTLSKPQHPVMLLFEGIASADLEVIKLSCNIPEQFLTPQVNELAGNPIATAAVKLIFRNLSYTVDQVEETGETTATVKVQVHYPDCTPLIHKSFEAYVPKAVEGLMNGSFDQNALTRDVLLQMASDLVSTDTFESIDQTVDIKCFQEEDGRWQLIMDGDLMNICCANGVNAVKSLDLNKLAKQPKNGA